MKWNYWWQRNELDDELQNLELNLKAALIPVNPRPEFVDDLRNRLMKQPLEIDLVREPKNQKLQTGLLITSGVLGAIAIVLTGVRGAVSIAGIIGLLINVIKQNSQNSSPIPSN